MGSEREKEIKRRRQRRKKRIKRRILEIIKDKGKKDKAVSS